MKPNPKKQNSARRKRPKYIEELPKVKWVLVNGKYKQIFPANPRGQNHAERRKLKAMNKS
jgi:hypothetical protein